MQQDMFQKTQDPDPGSQTKTPSRTSTSEIPGTQKSDRPHTSASAVTLYVDRCGEYYRRKYIDKERFPPPPFLIKGSAVHAGNEINFQQKIKTHEDLPASKVMDATAAAFDAQIQKEGYMLTSKDEGIGSSKVLGSAKDSAVALSKLFIEKVAPVHQPVVVETFQRIKLNEKMDILVKLDMINDRQEIQDTKTSKQTMSVNAARDSFQFKLYGLAYQALYKRPAAGVVVDNLVHLKGGPKHTRLDIFIGQKQYQEAVEKINIFLAGTNLGVFMPAQKGSWFCNEDHCPAAPTCKYFQFYKRGGGKTPVPPWMRFRGKKKKEEATK